MILARMKSLDLAIKESDLFTLIIGNDYMTRWRLTGTDYIFITGLDTGSSLQIGGRWVKDSPHDMKFASTVFTLHYKPILFEEVFENINVELQSKLLFYLDLLC